MAGSIIDSLVVTLGLDAAKFKKGAKETDEALDKTSKNTTKVSKDMEAWGKNAAVSIGKLRNEVLGLLAVFTAGVGIKNFVENTINSTASLGRMSANLNMSAKDLAEWQLANKNAGGTVEGMTAQLKESAQAVQAYRAGMMTDSTKQAFFFGAGKISADDLKSGETWLRARSKLVADIYKVDPTRAKFVADQIGISEDAFNLLKQQPAALEAARAAQERLAQAQADASAAAEELRKRFDTLKNNFEAVGVRILTRLLPILERFAKWLDDHQDDIDGFMDGFVKAVSTASDLVLPVLNMIADGWKKIYEWVKAAGQEVNDFMPKSWSNAIGKGVSKVVDFFTGGDKEAAKPSTPSTTKRSSEQYVLAQLKADGYTDAQAAGIMGSLMQESGLNPTARNGKSGAYGIGQWLGPRKQDFAKRFGHDLNSSTLEEQTAFMLWELRNTEKRAGNLLRGATTAEQAASIHSKEYERPGAFEANDVARQAYAARLYSKMGNGGNTSTSETNINGPINIVTQATDAPGIAKDIGRGLKDVAFTSQANAGLQ